MIVLTHVCRAWRELFTSRSSLWTDFTCMDADKTLVYLERSKSSPTINLSLRNYGNPYSNPSPPNLFFQTIPHIRERLKSLYAWGLAECLQDILDHLSRPAPLLEDLSIECRGKLKPDSTLTLTPALFSGDLSSLRTLDLQDVNTNLPWRNMVNLTSLTLHEIRPVSMSQLLDFFESAPHLRDVALQFEIPTGSDQTGRLVSLADLEEMYIDGGPSSDLLDHLLIPVGARLSAVVEFSSSHPTRFLSNLRNFPDFTTIKLTADPEPRIKFSGPKGNVDLNHITYSDDELGLVLEFLALFDTSGTKQLKIHFDHNPSGDQSYQILLPMKTLRTLRLEYSPSSHDFIQVLDPSKSSSGVVVCPKLEELIIQPNGKLDINDVIGMAAARESRGAKLNSLWIFNPLEPKYAQSDVLKLKGHVSRVEVIEWTGMTKRMTRMIKEAGDIGSLEESRLIMTGE